MARAEGALFRTAETVPEARPRCFATSLSVTLPGGLMRDCFPFPIPRDYRRPLLISALKLTYRTKQSKWLSERGRLVLAPHSSRFSRSAGSPFSLPCRIHRERIGYIPHLQRSPQLVHVRLAPQLQSDRLAGKQIKIIVGNLNHVVAEARVYMTSQDWALQAQSVRPGAPA